MVPAHEAELVDELAQHLDDQYNELRARGRSDDEARLQLASQLTDEFLRAAADSWRRARHAPLHILSELAAVVAYNVNWRTTRSACAWRSVLARVTCCGSSRQALTLTAVGVVIGVPLAIAAAHVDPVEALRAE